MISTHLFWRKISEAVGNAPWMRPEDAASMMARRLDEYQGLWTYIEAETRENPAKLRLLKQAAAIRDSVA
ncbi:hypothetical protein [Bradyrhizobium sp. USDA 3256]